MEHKVLVAWSGGKDSAMALYDMRNRTPDTEISALLTTVTKDYARVSMHGTRFELLKKQVASIGCKSEIIYITKESTNEEYERNMAEKLKEYMAKGVNLVVFGDIFLEDLRKYREDNLAKLGMKGIFPIWKINTKALAEQFISFGFKAIITCVDTKVLDKSFAGREFDKKFLSDLPSNIDPCGENGEFHSFVYDGPYFKEPVAVKRGECVLRDNRFYFCDLK